MKTSLVGTSHEPFLEVNEDFVFNPMEFSINTSDLIENIEGPFDVVDTWVQNKHTDNLTDTIRNLSPILFPENEFLFYITGSKEIFQCAVIRTNDISLKGNIVVGMTRPKFCEAMNIDTYSDCIAISNLESTNKWVFYFNENKLDSVKYFGYVD